MPAILIRHTPRFNFANMTRSPRRWYCVMTCHGMDAADHARACYTYTDALIVDDQSIRNEDFVADTGPRLHGAEVVPASRPDPVMVSELSILRMQINGGRLSRAKLARARAEAERIQRHIDDFRTLYLEAAE
jgi:hypothetical protein